MPHRGRPSSIILTLTPQEQQALHVLLRRKTITHRLHRRIQAVMAVAVQGQSIAATATQYQLSRTHLYKWLRRFQAQRIPGLFDGTSGRPAIPRKDKERSMHPQENTQTSARCGLCSEPVSLTDLHPTSAPVPATGPYYAYHMGCMALEDEERGFKVTEEMARDDRTWILPFHERRPHA